MRDEETIKPLTGIVAKLQRIQRALNAPKSQFNSFGKYKYRSCEDILEAVKPLLAREACIITLSDKIVEISGRFYVEATATLRDADTAQDAIQIFASAREAEHRKGMDESQLTGSTSSYARKYALNGLLLIDDNKDADSMDNRYIEEDAEKPQASDAFREIHKDWLNGFCKEWGVKTSEVKNVIENHFEKAFEQLSPEELEEMHGVVERKFIKKFENETETEESR